MTEKIGIAFVLKTETDQDVTLNSLEMNDKGHLLSIINPDMSFHAVELSRGDLKRLHKCLEFMIWGTVSENRP